MLVTSEVAHILAGATLLAGATALIAFLLHNPSFGWRFKFWMTSLALGLASIGAFHFALLSGEATPLSVPFAVLAVAGSAAASLAIAVLSQTAFQSRLISALHHRVEAHRRTLRRLQRSRDELEDRVKERTSEIHEQERRLRVALRDSQITVSMQDTNLRYVWIRNAPDGFNAPDLIDKTDEDILPAEPAQIATRAKREVIETGSDITTELCIVMDEDGQPRLRYFDITVEPYYDENGVIQGVLTVSVETTDKRRREEILKEALLEVSHRTKNQLSILMSIARRLAVAKPETRIFLPAFESRLRAMAICQDVLVERDWSAPNLSRLIEAQLRPYTDMQKNGSVVFKFEGPDVKITPTAVQSLGLVLNELALNAAESGALDARASELSVSWALVDDRQCEDSDDCTKHLEIYWLEKEAKQAKSTINNRPKKGVGLSLAKTLATSALSGRLEIHDEHPNLSIRLQVGSSSLAIH